MQETVHDNCTWYVTIFPLTTKDKNAMADVWITHRIEFTKWEGSNFCSQLKQTRLTKQVFCPFFKLAVSKTFITVFLSDSEILAFYFIFPIPQGFNTCANFRFQSTCIIDEKWIIRWKVGQKGFFRWNEAILTVQSGKRAINLGMQIHWNIKCITFIAHYLNIDKHPI